MPQPATTEFDDFEVPVRENSGKTVVVRLGGGASVPKAPPAPMKLPAPKPATLPEKVPEERVAIVSVQKKLPPQPAPPLASRPQSPRPAAARPTQPVRPEPPPSPVGKEAREHRTRVMDVYEQMTEDIVAAAGLALPEALQQRLRLLIMARLKGVRDAVETAEATRRPVAVAGLGLDGPAASKLLDILDARFHALEKELSRTVKQKTIEAIEAESAARTARATSRDNAAAARTEALVAAITKKPEATAATPLPPPAAPAPLRPLIRDVAARPTLVGPSEELRRLTLADMRKLSRDPVEAAARVRDKIALLREEGFTRYREAVAAWRESEPFRLYQKAIIESLRAGRPVRELLSAAPEGLTPGEFDAILSMNATLGG